MFLRARVRDLNMADSSSDSSELRNFLKELRSRGGGRLSPSRIPRPEALSDSATVAKVEQSRKPGTNRAAALLDKVAHLGQRKHANVSRPTEDSSPTTSVTVSSGSKKEVAFDLGTQRARRAQGNNSRIPRSPNMGKRKDATDAANRDSGKVPSPKRVLTPDFNRHQARRSPSPYHKNCQHTQLSAANSPEPADRGASPKLARNAAARAKPPARTKVASPTPREKPPHETATHEGTSSSKGQGGLRDKPARQKTETVKTAQSDATDTASRETRRSQAAETEKSQISGTRRSDATRTDDTSATPRSKTTEREQRLSSMTAKSLQTSRTENADSSTGPNTVSAVRNVDSSASKRGSGHQRTSAEYSDTFEETTSKVRTASASSSSFRRQTRSKSLDTGLGRHSSSTKVASSKASKRSKSSTVPDWWFPGILPPRHLGGDHLEQLHQLHLGVLDDLFRFQMGLIEKHQQRSETRYKAMNEFVKRNHSYTTWQDYQADPRTHFFSWQRNSASADFS